MRRINLLALGILLLLVAEASGAGGGGSSGFGGGGGGGGGFSGGGSSSGGSGGGSVSPVVIVLIFGFALAFVVFGWIAAARARQRRMERNAAVTRASAVAADDDEAFDAETVKARAKELFEAVQVAWDRRDREALAALAGPSLMEEWKRRLDDFDNKRWHNRVQLTATPEILYVGLVNRAEDTEDRVVVRIACKADDYVKEANGNIQFKNGSKSKSTMILEYWTMAKHDGAWRVESIESDDEGAHHLDGAVVTSPFDDERLHDEAVAERAAADALPAGMSPAEFADLDFDGPARAAAQDLALADGRFDPALIEASVRRAVDAWVTAVDGADDPLAAVATPDAVQELLYPGDPGRDKRLVVRGPRLEAITITGLDAAATPPALSVELAARGRRYVEDRDTAAVVSGDRESESSFTEHWTLVLDGEGEWPWRIASVGARPVT